MLADEGDGGSQDTGWCREGHDDVSERREEGRKGCGSREEGRTARSTQRIEAHSTSGEGDGESSQDGGEDATPASPLSLTTHDHGCGCSASRVTTVGPLPLPALSQLTKVHNTRRGHSSRPAGAAAGTNETDGASHDAGQSTPGRERFKPLKLRWARCVSMNTFYVKSKLILSAHTRVHQRACNKLGTTGPNCG